MKLELTPQERALVLEALNVLEETWQRHWQRIAPSDDELAEIESHFSGIPHLREKLKQPTTGHNLN